MTITPEEEGILHELRDNRIEFGKIPVIFYYRYGKVVRMEIERIIESKAIKQTKL